MKVKKILCVAALIAAVIILLPTSAAAAGRFSDVKSGAWYYDAVEYVAERGIMMGTTDTEFSPTKSMTRAQLVTVLYRLSGTTETGFSDKLTFKDTKKSAWYAEYVGWAVEKGLVGGYTDNTFKPDRAVTRQEIAKLLVEFFSMMNIDVSHCTPLSDSFSDAGKFQSWSREYIDALRKTGLIAGDGNGNFNPAKSATRAEIATILKRYFETIYDEMYFIDGKLDELKCPEHSRMVHYSVAYDEDDSYGTAISLRMMADSLGNYLSLDSGTYELSLTS
ncbi:MAG: S-layer homology domain-containing protein, partial [Clostridia bacterium]|nr:S-layer homology domain-containing protein [Clostridia bacterium]